MKHTSLSTFINEDKINWYNPVQLSASALNKIAAKTEVLLNIIATLKQLSPDDYSDYIISYYKSGIEKFGSSWDYNDLLTILYASAATLKPENYLEIGVRRGRSLGVAVSAHPNINLYGFDLWMSNYAGMENPGPEFVTDELKKLNHRGNLTLISGDSKKTIPEFYNAHPDLYFDLITVDGDHSKKGAYRDLINVLPRLKMGGVLLLDDICHPQHKYLEKLWDKVIGKSDDFVHYKYTELGYGIAFAIRREFNDYK